MKAPAILTRLNDRFFRAAALREARARAALPEPKAAALRQAVLLVEIARRVADPIQELPAGARPAVRLGLYRDAVHWALVAGGPAEVEAPRDLRAAWESTPQEKLLAAAREPAALDRIAVALLGDGVTALSATDEDARLAGAFTDALVTEIDGPRRAAERIAGQRWMRILLAGVALVLVAYGVRAAALGTNLAADKPFRTSSSWAGCPLDPGCAGLAFCTDSQMNPWATLDLGKPTTFHRIDVTNRGDCCAERAVPLIVEVSDNDVTWREVARRDAEFSKWTVKLPATTARYVRFKVPRQTVFHLQEVAIR